MIGNSSSRADAARAANPAIKITNIIALLLLAVLAHA